jgi:ribosome-associated protein
VAKTKPKARKTAAKPKKKKPARKLAKKPAAKKAPKAKIKKAAAKIAHLKRPAGLPEQLRDAALRVLDERKAEEIVVVNLEGKSSVADYLIVASGHASRQIAAIAHYLQEAFGRLGAGRTRIEGLPEANWVLVDAGDIIVHLFRPDVRRYYNIENLWENEEADIERSALLLE